MEKYIPVLKRSQLFSGLGEDEIASMLHYSAWTVYNLRSSLRSMSDLPKAEFEARIASL